MSSSQTCAFCDSTRARRRQLAKQLADMLQGRVRSQMPAGEILQAQRIYAEINQLRAQEATPVCQECYTQASTIMTLKQLPTSNAMTESSNEDRQACTSCEQAWKAKDQLGLYTMKEMWKSWRDQCTRCIGSPNLSPDAKARYNEVLYQLQLYILKTL